MVHALREACRVLKSDGLLIDLRPAPVHRHVGIIENGSYVKVGVMREFLIDDRCANRAVADMIGSRKLRLKMRTRFECTRTMDRLSEFKDRLDELVQLGKGSSHEWLLRRMKEALASRASDQTSRRRKIFMRGPMDLRVLIKTE
jgi:hypothetical protein